MFEEPILFIGGPFDGKRKMWESSVPYQKVLTATLGDPIESWYRIQSFTNGTVRHNVAVHETVQDILSHLIRGYNPAR